METLSRRAVDRIYSAVYSLHLLSGYTNSRRKYTWQSEQLTVLLAVVVLSWSYVIYASRIASHWLLERRTGLLPQV